MIKCDKCGKDISGEKEILNLTWGEPNKFGEVDFGECRLFCSIGCLVANFGYAPHHKHMLP